MLKRILITLVIMLFTVTISYAETPNIYIEDVVKKENEDKVTIDLHLDNVNSNVASLGLDIKYDDKKLEYVSSKSGKNLKTTVQMAEYEENNKISIKIMSSNGLKADGIYYQVTFKVLDENVDEIPVKLEVKDAKDIGENNVNCKVNSGIIYTDESKKPSTGNNDNKNDDSGTKIDPFDKTDVKPSDKLDDIINSNTTPNTQDKDNIKYEVKDPNILEVLPNGTMVAKQDGITKVKVKKDDEDIGDLEVETENGQIKRISSQSETEGEDITSKTENEFNTTNKVKKKSVTEGGTKISLFALLVILIVVVAISIIIYKKKYKNKKKEKKNGKVN